MLIKIVSFIFFLRIEIIANSNLQWNIGQPYKYNGLIYTDSHVVVVNPAIQIKLSNDEEICNFHINQSADAEDPSQFFRAVVKSAHLGLGELEVRPNVTLEDWRNQEITFTIVAEACHDPDSWSTPAIVSIRVLDPPGPLWTKSQYRVTVDRNATIGTVILQVRAYMPKWIESDNGICQYYISSPTKSPFQIDGEGTIRVTESLTNLDVQHWALIVAARDCSQPSHRQSHVNVLVSINPSCKFGWTGFYTRLKYKPGSGIKYLCKNPRFHICHKSDSESRQAPRVTETTIRQCIANRTLRFTTSIELRSLLRATSSTDAELSDRSNCKFDSHSLKLQREVCGISESYTLDLLSELNKHKTGVLPFPIQANLFPAASLASEDKFSFFFWMKKDPMTEVTEEYIVCQVDEVASNIFSVSLKQCVLNVHLKSYDNKYRHGNGEQSVPTSWAFQLPQLCDSKWHHVAILASRAADIPYSAQINVFIDGEMTEYRTDNPEIEFGALMPPLSSNVTDIFLGQCPKSENTEFKGLLAAVTFTNGVLIKSSTPRCLTKCSERLYFNGMNRMNPGMSVSLNSEMQMIIINGHSIDEVTSLVRVVAYVNPTWDPVSGDRHLIIETEMSCGKLSFSVSPIKVLIQVEGQRSLVMGISNTVTLVTLFSTVTTILVPDSSQTNPDAGSGVAVFANTTLKVSGIPQSTESKIDDVSPTISRCVVTMNPILKTGDYIEWPRDLLEVVARQKYPIRVTNNSRTVVFHGWHNQQVYQFLLQNLRYFTTTTITTTRNQDNRIFKLQCFSNAGNIPVKSNVVVVKVTVWYNNNLDSVSSMPPVGDARTWQDLWNASVIRDNPSLHALSNAALISEVDTGPRKSNKVVFNLLLVMGLLMLTSSVAVFIRKTRRRQQLQNHDGHRLTRTVFDSLCASIKMVKERIAPSPSVRVELSRDYLQGTGSRRREVSMEMQWDDAELQAHARYNIITNPMYETSIGDIDDSAINIDVPPQCEEDDNMTDDDDTYDDFTDLYLDRNRMVDKSARR